MIRPAKTFCDIPFADLDQLEDADVAVFGSRHGTPYKPGTASHAANGPGVIRDALSWYSSNPEQFDFDTMKQVFGGNHVVDCGDIDASLTDGAGNRALIADTTRQILASGTIPILIGGDDSNPIPFIEAVAETGPVTILQIDAHIDWREEVDGETHGFSSTMRRASEMPNVEDIIQVGARGPGSARASDLEEAKSWGAKFVTARDLHRDGLDPVIELIPEGSNVIMAIDVDALDPSLVPGVILPAFGGLTYPQISEIILRTSERANIVAYDFVEFVPENDEDGLSASAISRIICVAIGCLSPST